MPFKLTKLALLCLAASMLFHESMQQKLDDDDDDGENGNSNDIRGDTPRGGSSRTFSCYTCNVQAGQDDTEQCNERAEECPAASALLPAAPFNGCSTLLHFTAAGSRSAAELQPTDAAAESVDGVRARVRKFCTSAGSAELLAPLLTRLAENGGAGGICQPLDSWARISADPLLPSIVEGTVGARLLLPHGKRGGAAQRRGGGVTAPMGDEQRQTMTGRIGRAAQAGGGPPAAAPMSQSSSSILCVCTKSLCNEGDFEDILSRSIYVAGIGTDENDRTKFVAETSANGNGKNI